MFQIVQFGICTFTWRESKESTSDSEENEHEQAEDSNESVDECEVQFRNDNLELRTFEKDMEIFDTTSRLSNRTDNFKKRRAEQRNDESDSQSCSSGKSEICGRKRKRQGQGQGQGPTYTCGEKNKSHGYYEAKPFNFYIFPFSRVGNSKRDLIFGSLNRSLEFLAKNSFDFNKWVYDGISYATLDEITRFKTEKLDLLEGKSLISTSERDLEFLNGFQEKIRSLLSSEGKDSIRIDTKGSYQQRLVHQEIRNYTQLYAKGRKGMVDIFKDTEDYVKAHRDSLVDDVHVSQSTPII
ncbi:Poly(A)-specific ribonuclease PARN [Zancudomyces culisetae]|uniref:Poly(A)-specific ribonuclease PARN n=1 Tax=Zancudomyces culisetae TaxID=1213189 RepID=A0A1R1PD70_ZANCU|nr:Poly(A)-specific ribonuclease PARN [Zancudomyces culisetae]|eukprot:OMH78917.1 Poly(A)-specific ribonuclease PARN [Zancudomyces culisetae]